MKHVAAFLLLTLAGNESPSAADVKSVLSSVGIDADEERLNKLISELEGKNIQEVSERNMTPLRRVRIQNTSLTIQSYS